MEKLYSNPSEFDPEIILDPDEKNFIIRGNSRPENVGETFSPVVDWLNEYFESILNGNGKEYSGDNPFIMIFDFYYFNSSTVKFLYDITLVLKKWKEEGIPLEVAWRYLEEDEDMRDAGEDLAYLAGLDFTFIKKQ